MKVEVHLKGNGCLHVIVKVIQANRVQKLHCEDFLCLISVRLLTTQVKLGERNLMNILSALLRTDDVPIEHRTTNHSAPFIFTSLSKRVLVGHRD